jgi:ribonuclease HI
MLYAQTLEKSMNPTPNNPTSDSTGRTWIRMRFRKNKVWVEAGADGCLRQKDGRVRIKYQLDQPHEYHIRAQSLEPLTPAAPASTAAGPQPERSAASRRAAEAERVVHVYTDGACAGNPGPAGIGVVLQYGSQRKEISDFIGEATNNIAELQAIQRGLAAVKNRRLPVRVYTDSSYAYGILSLNWKPQKNKDLIAAIRRSMAAFADLKLVKVRGHHGIEENERADELATSAIRQAGR